ncbi:MAG: nucleotidyltransferase family protein [Clostridiales bacterium]|nr:nucleotidyltransferase family protein [Clostridiales bacterium]
MKTAAVIAEYNPFHNGHFYQLREIRRQTGADAIVAVMSGDYVQRGEAAVFDKYTRTRMALSCGVDLVLELPVALATSSAEDFAAGAVSLLDDLGVIDLLCFGSESGDLNALKHSADLLSEEPEELSAQLRELLRQGMTYPAARSAALSHLSGEMSHEQDAPRSNGPNDILAIAYLNALTKLDSHMEPCAIRRCGQGYHDPIDPKTMQEPVSDSSLRKLQQTEKGYASASGIRAGLEALTHSALPVSSDQTERFLQAHIPEAAMTSLKMEGAASSPIFADDLSVLLNARILELLHEGISFDRFADMSPDLADRLKRHALTFESFSGRIRQLKTRQYTYTRVSRALLHLLLGIPSGFIRDKGETIHVPYARILGLRRSAAPLLSEIRRRSSLPLLTRIAEAERSLDDVGVAWLRQELFASHLYQSLVFQKGRAMKNEYTRSVVVLP